MPCTLGEVTNLSLSTLKVRNQDAVYGLGVSREGHETAWRWFKVHVFRYPEHMKYKNISSL